MNKSVSTNQASLILVIFTISLKLSVLPAITCDYAGKNATLVSLIALTVDFLLTLAIVAIIRKIPTKSFFTLIRETLSRPIAIIVYIFLFIYFFLKLMITMLELHDYYIATLFDKLNPLFYIISLTFFMLFFFGRSYRTIGRLIEICFWPLVIGIAFTLLLPISDVRLFNLLPLMEDGIYPIYQSLIRTSFAYGDYMILFLLMGNISYSAKPIKKILIYMSSMLNFIFDFYLIFVGTFETTTINQSLALGELPLHNPNPTTIGRLEWLTVIMWTGILLIQLSIIGSSCSKCLQEIFGLSDRKWTVYVVTILVVVGYFATYLKLEKLITIATSWVFVGIANGFHVFCISLLYIAYFVLKRRERSYKPIKTKGGLREKNYQQTY